VGDECDEAHGRGEAFRLHQLVANRHRGRGVDEEANRDLVVCLEQFDQDLVEPGHDVVVDASEVVARVVLAEVGEVDCVPVALRLVLATETTHQTVPAVELEALEPGHQCRAEQAGHGAPRISAFGSGTEWSSSSMMTSVPTPSAVAS
jgi:hypothetical protein